MASPSPPKATTHFPPTYPPLTHPSLILFGTIDPSPQTAWTTTLTTTLSDLPIQILNPRRDDWDASWREEVSFAPFRETVEWDIFHAEAAALIVFYFGPGSNAPVSLLELGMYAALYGGGREGAAEREGKVVVCCPEGFYKRGHVEIVCGRLGVRCVGEFGELGSIVRERMEGLCKEKEKGGA